MSSNSHATRGLAHLLASLLVLALLAGCREPPRSQLAPIEALPILAKTARCATHVGIHAIVCRSIPVGWASQVDAYINELLKQNWRTVTPGYGLSGIYEMAPGEFTRGEYVSGAVWFERPRDANCSQRLSLNVIGLVPEPKSATPSPAHTANSAGLVEILLIADYPPVCGAQRQFKSR